MSPYRLSVRALHGAAIAQPKIAGVVMHVRTPVQAGTGECCGLNVHRSTLPGASSSDVTVSRQDGHGQGFQSIEANEN